MLAPSCLWEELPGVVWAPSLRRLFARRRERLDEAVLAGRAARRALAGLIAHRQFGESGLEGFLHALVFLGEIDRRCAAALAFDLGGERWREPAAAGELRDEPRPPGLDLGAPTGLPSILWRSTRLLARAWAWHEATRQAAAGRAARAVLRRVARLSGLAYEDILWALTDTGECGEDEVRACLRIGED